MRVRPVAALLLLIVGAVSADERVRSPAIAGSWYPGDAAELTAYLDRALDSPSNWAVPAEERLQALIAPHAAYAYSGATAAAGYRLLRGQAFDRVILLGPSHRAGFRGVAIAGVDAFETPLGRVPLDGAAVARLRESPLVVEGPPGPDREHSLLSEGDRLSNMLIFVGAGFTPARSGDASRRGRCSVQAAQGRA